MNKLFNLGLVILLAIVFSLNSCSDDNVSPKEEEDYFPTNKNIVYTFKSNVYSDKQDSMSTFEMKIAEHVFSKGTFLAILVKRTNDSKWHSIIGIKDSGNVIYSLGDFPPEGMFPMFKHKYDENEVTSESITIEGKKYNAKRYDLTRENVSVSWWFVNGIGLVKEESSVGYSLFSDNHFNDNYTVKTELMSFKKQTK